MGEEAGLWPGDPKKLRELLRVGEEKGIIPPPPAGGGVSKVGWLGNLCNHMADHELWRPGRIGSQEAGRLCYCRLEILNGFLTRGPAFPDLQMTSLLGEAKDGAALLSNPISQGYAGCAWGVGSAMRAPHGLGKPRAGGNGRAP